MNRFSELDLISMFDDVLKENKLTKKVLLGTKRDPLLLFGKYNEINFSYMEKIFELSIFKEKHLSLDNDFSFVNNDIKKISGFMLVPYLAFKIYSEDKNPEGVFDLIIYKDNIKEIFSDYSEKVKIKGYNDTFEMYHKDLKPQAKIVINVVIEDGEILLRNKDVVAKY